MKVPSYESSWPVDEMSAAHHKVVTPHGSPVKEAHVLKAQMNSIDVATLYLQHDYTQDTLNKKAAAGRDYEGTIPQVLQDSGYLSQHNSHLEDDTENHAQTVLPVVEQEERVTPKASPRKSPEKRSPMTVFTPLIPHKRNDFYSMSSTPADKNASKLPIQMFTKAVCEELSRAFQKNKRYDFSIVSRIAENYNLDRVIGGHMGLDYVDVFASLLSRNMKCILAQVLSLLGDLDLISCTKVSKTWRQIINDDQAALKRCQQAEKTLRESELAQRLTSGLTRDASLSRVVLSGMQHMASALQPNMSTPNRTRFDEFSQVAGTLKQGQSLRPCKRCGSPATFSREAHRATCTRSSCEFVSCTHCNESFHGSTPCRLRPLRSTSSVSKTSSLLPGSARSKRNVRRL
uniref:ZBR-type domain-containing protein n=1 Tax=Knipowitschia caucasica TaxID=637954 RepID=A0AAV2JK37_KNICA